MQRQKFKRKHFFINYKLQGRYMLTFFIPMMIILVFMIFTLYFVSQSIVDTAAIIVKNEIQDKIALQFQDETNQTVDAYKNILWDINTYLRNFSKNEKYRSLVSSSILYVFGMGVFIVIIQIVLLTIFFSHKLAGPIYRFESMCHNVINGNYTEKVVLRAGDEMQNLGNLLNEVLEKTRDRFKKISKAETEEEKKEILSSIEF